MDSQDTPTAAPEPAACVVSAVAGDRPRLAQLLERDGLVVVALCAGWCGACREFRPAFERIAAALPNVGFVWLDVEDDNALVGDIDVENFPTLAVYRAGRPLFYGVSLPHESVVLRLVQSLANSTRVVTNDAAVHALPGLLAQHAGAAV